MLKLINLRVNSRPPDLCVSGWGRVRDRVHASHRMCSCVKPPSVSESASCCRQEEEARIEVEEDETRKQLKANREHHKNWEGNREKRIGNWREYEKKKKPKKAKSGIRPPKLKVGPDSYTLMRLAPICRGLYCVEIIYLCVWICLTNPSVACKSAIIPQVANRDVPQAGVVGYASGG